MRLVRRLTTLLALLAVCTACTAPLGVADSDSQSIQLQALAATWSAGAPQDLGPFIVARDFQKDAGPGSPAPADSFFAIKAERLRVEVDSNDAYLRVPGVAYHTPEPFKGQDTTDYTQALLQGEASRAERHLYVFPAFSGATLSSPCGTMQPSEEIGVSAPSLMNMRGPIYRHTLDSVEVLPCDATDVTVMGSFLVVLWEWDAILRAAGEDVRLWSGQAPRDTGPDTRPYLSKAQQIYLWVEDGSFTMASQPDRPLEVFMDSVQFSQLPSLSLLQATGELPDDPTALDGHRVELTGSLDVEVAKGEALLEVQVTDGLQTVVADGQEVYSAPAPQAAAAEPWHAGWPLWASLTAGAIALVGLAFLYRHVTPWSPYCHDQASLANEKGHFTRASLWAWLATRQREDGDPHLLRAHLLTMRNRFDAALGAHKAAHQAYAGSRHTTRIVANALEAARTCQSLGRSDEMREWLGLAQEGNPSEAYRLLLRPDLASLRTQSFDQEGYS